MTENQRRLRVSQEGSGWRSQFWPTHDNRPTPQTAVRGLLAKGTDASVPREMIGFCRPNAYGT
jgi:hypothetical protein